MLKNFLRKFLFNPSIIQVENKYQNVNLTIGNSLLFDSFCLSTKLPQERKYLSIGNDCMVGGLFNFESATGEIIIGDRVYIGGGQFICINKIEIESDVFISWGCYFFDNDSHSVEYRHRLTDMQNHLKDWRAGLPNYNTSKNWGVVKSVPIKVCRFAWIGMECKILKGVTIGEGAIVGSGSVVTKDVAPWTIVAGNPAKVIKELPEKLKHPRI